MHTEIDYQYVTTKLAADNIHAHREQDILYKYASVCDAVKIISGNSLLYQIPDRFNDPFELHKGLFDFKDATYAMLWQRMKASGKYTDKQIEYVMSHVTEKQMVDEADKVMSGGKSKMGILCMSKTNISTLMWSHYSHKHTGVCLGFKIPNGMPDLITMAYSVNYAEKVIPRKVNFDGSLDDMVAVLRWVCTKAATWEYEKEVRVINMIQSGIIPFEVVQLKELYFGVSTTEQAIEEILDAVKLKGYTLQKIAKMTIDRNTFDLQVIPYVP